MIRSAVLSFALVAAPAFAQTADEVAAMTKAVEEAGCVVTADNGDAVLAASGLSEEQTLAVIAQMYSDGAVALTENGDMKLTSAVCQ